jgi:hypothetical protein
LRRDCRRDAIWAELHMASREPMGREASPWAAILDGQSVKSAEKGVANTTKGYDAGKQVNGPKIHALVDSEGLPLRVVVHSAAIQSLPRRRPGTVTQLGWSSTKYARASCGSN